MSAIVKSGKEAANRDLMTRQDLPDTFGAGHGRRRVTVNAERQDATLPDQPDDLGIDFRRVVHNRAGLSPGYEQAIIAVAAVGKAFGKEARAAGPPRERLQPRLLAAAPDCKAHHGA